MDQRRWLLAVCPQCGYSEVVRDRSGPQRYLSDAWCGHAMDDFDYVWVGVRPFVAVPEDPSAA
jgi:hypothetical protein